MKMNTQGHRGGKRRPSSIHPESEETPDDHFDDNPSIILPMSGYRDTRKWDSMVNKIKKRVIAYRRNGSEVAVVPNDDDPDVSTPIADIEEEDEEVLRERVEKKIQARNKLDVVDKYVPLSLSDLPELHQPDIQSNFCFKCWMLVSGPPIGLSCLYCPLIAHRHCVDIIQTQEKIKIRELRERKGLETLNAESMEFDSEVTTPAMSPRVGQVDVLTPEELNKKWVCPFCVDMLHDHNSHMKEKEDNSKKVIEERRRMITMAATARMYVVRKRWINRVRCSIKIQRFLRARLTMYSMRDELRATKSVLRVVIHELELRLGVATEWDLNEHAVLRNIGHFGSIMLPNYMKALPREKSELKPAIDVFKASLGPGIHIRPAEKAISAKSVVLTVTVHDMLDGEKQLYRLDIPMMEKVKRNRGKKKKMLSGAGSDDESVTSQDNFSLVSNSTDDTKSSSINKQVYFRPQIRGAMVFPACHADALLRFTASEVSKWPNSVCLARSEMVVTDFVLKRQSAVLSQRLDKVNRGDKVIELAHLTRLNIANVRGTRADPSRFLLGHGRITWGVVTATGSSTVAGPLLLLPDPESWGAKKKTWCAIIDKMFYVYGSVADVIARETVDLKNCKVLMHENEVTKIRNSITYLQFC